MSYSTGLLASLGYEQTLGREYSHVGASRLRLADRASAVPFWESDDTTLLSKKPSIRNLDLQIK